MSQFSINPLEDLEDDTFPLLFNVHCKTPIEYECNGERHLSTNQSRKIIC